MLFIEVHDSEAEAVVQKVLAKAFSSVYAEQFSSLRFGRTIQWNGRTFREVILSDRNSLVREDMIFRLENLPPGKARILVGSFHSGVFVTPPEVGVPLAARIKDPTREFTVHPFHSNISDADL